MFNGDLNVLVGPVGLGCLSLHNEKESNWFFGVSSQCRFMMRIPQVARSIPAQGGN